MKLLREYRYVYNILSEIEMSFMRMRDNIMLYNFIIIYITIDNSTIILIFWSKVYDLCDFWIDNMYNPLTNLKRHVYV